MNTIGANNTAAGAFSLSANTTGVNNAALGIQALSSNSTGSYNLAAGGSALLKNTTGSRNTAIGEQALGSSTTGSSNFGMGYGAGFNVTTGSNNIEIGNAGSGADSGAIRIGLQGTQTYTFIAGIAGSAVTGSDVVVNGSGQLGVVVSSARYKRDINNMGSSTDGLMKLRPVTFIYKNDQQGVKQYGLVAEEVDKVYPELVVHDEAGKVESVRYSMLTSMLLNELQKQTRELAEVRHQLKAAREDEATMRASFDERLSKLEHTMAAERGDRNIATAYGKLPIKTY